MGGTLNVGHDQAIELLQVLLLVENRENREYTGNGRGGGGVSVRYVKRKRWEGKGESEEDGRETDLPFDVTDCPPATGIMVGPTRMMHFDLKPKTTTATTRSNQRDDKNITTPSIGLNSIT